MRPFLPSSCDRLVLSERSLFPFDAGAVTPARSLLVLLPLERLRDLITSVLSEMGRGRPFILKKSAHALQRMCVLSWDRLHSGVVCWHQKSSVSSPS